LAAGLRRGDRDRLAADDIALRLMADRIGVESDPAPGAVRPSTHRARLDLIADAREALAMDPGLSLGDLAHSIGTSPYPLSRLFPIVTGGTLTRWRNELRVRIAMTRLEDRQSDLAGLAADLGFSDHAHMTRVIKSHLGAPPSKVRDLLQGNETPPKLRTN
jgi:transcriptional regulator GlxA family with amidase domain